jgi:amino-acid N-acetyltransferase
VIDGVDLELTGVTRKVAAEKIQTILGRDNMVLLSPLGFSPTGEAFNLTMEDVACSTAIALHADKLIFITETADDDRRRRRRDPRTVLAPGRSRAAGRLPAGDAAFYLQHASRPATTASTAPTSCPSTWTARPCSSCSPTMAWAP